MSLSNIGKITKAIKSSNVDDLYELLKGTGSVKNAAELLSKYSNLGKDYNAKALKNAFNLSDIAEAEAALANVGTAATGVGGKLAEMANTGKLAIRGLVSQFGPLLAVIAAATVAVAAFKWADNKYNITKGTVDKKYDDASSDYSETLSEIYSLNSQLEDTKARILELNAMENLSIVDQYELNNLQKQNDLLEAQIALKQKIANTQQKSSA